MSQSVQKAITIVVTTSYLVKSALKITGGFIMGIPVLIADGIHGLFDIIEHGFLVLGGYYARKDQKTGRSSGIIRPGQNYDCHL